MSGTLYLLHWDPPLVGGQRPQHYLGWTNRNYEDRVLDHFNNGPHAAKIVVAAVEAGCEIRVAKVWPGSRADESRLKKAKHGFRHMCPLCVNPAHAVGYGIATIRILAALQRLREVQHG